MGVIRGMPLNTAAHRSDVVRVRLTLFALVIVVVREPVAQSYARGSDGNHQGREGTNKWEARKSHHRG